MYTVKFMTQAQKDAKRLASSGLKEKVLKLLEIIEKNPLQYPPEYEFLKGDMSGLISRRINKQHRLVYEVFEEEKLIKVYPHVESLRVNHCIQVIAMNNKVNLPGGQRTYPRCS